MNACPITSARFFLLTLAVVVLAPPSTDAKPGEPINRIPDSYTIRIPDTNWNLWLDSKAEWKNDPLFLPADVDLTKLPVHPPTGGWSVLDQPVPSDDDSLGDRFELELPATVEQVAWGHQGLRPYTKDEYYFAQTDNEVKNGVYTGVSWWWHDVSIPRSWANRAIVQLHIRAARQRVEVYVNEQLCGYSIVAETPVIADITKAIRPGKINRIALRITNPGGRLDWNDGYTVTWGNYKFQESHGFGGLDRDLYLEAHNPVYISDSWVLNTADPHQVEAYATLFNGSSEPSAVTAAFSIVDPVSRAVIFTPVTIPSETLQPGQSTTVSALISVPRGRLWTLEHPRLYNLRTELPAFGESVEKSFGFRSFEARGIGHRAGLYLNGQRIRLYTAISWGFWGINGLWPTPRLAQKEVISAKQLGLNCLNFHRNIGREEVLQAQDKLGLLRYMEPGGGVESFTDNSVNQTQSPKGRIDTSGNDGPALSFSEKYEVQKILAMVKTFRSHPSLVIYNLHNEVEPDFDNPLFFSVLRQMHQLDPSRIIVAKSGDKPICQAWFNPTSDPKTGFNPQPIDPILYDDGTGYSGWRDEHSVGGPGVWTDDLYQDPDHFTHNISDPREIVDWGEMLGSSSPDNHQLLLQQIRSATANGTSYDQLDHEQLQTAYHSFLDRWKFREAFPTDSAFYRNAGEKSYQFWARVLETARLCEDNDILSISGWESTAIENHSGLVDNMRNAKCDPELIRKKLAPLLPVLKPRGTIFRVHDPVTLDLYLVNETGHAVAGKLEASITDPSGESIPLADIPAPDFVPNQFVYHVPEPLEFADLTLPGNYQLNVKLVDSEGATLASNSGFLSAYETPSLPALKIGYLGANPDVRAQLAKFPKLTVEDWSPQGHYDLILNPRDPCGRVLHTDIGVKVTGTTDEPLFRSCICGRPETLVFKLQNLPNGPATVTLYFCESLFDQPDKRVFDVSINDQVVLKDFDIFATAHGRNMAISRSFPVTITGGALTIRPSHVVDHGVSENTRGEALFNAIKVEMAPAKGQPAKTIAYTCGGEAYTDAHGLVWEPYVPPGPTMADVLTQVSAGTPLMILTPDPGAADSAAQDLAAAHVLTYKGLVPSTRAPWMGNWLWVRDHPAFAGLPVNEVMKADYQIPVSSAYGLQVDGPDIQVIVGYGRDHDRNLGAATFTATHGSGTILFQTITQMNPILSEHLLAQSILWLTGSAK